MLKRKSLPISTAMLQFLVNNEIGKNDVCLTRKYSIHAIDLTEHAGVGERIYSVKYRGINPDYA